ncbi:GNAT family N-acetyltransferase [Virgibacillus ihumii]|uniref:GNAT family N-acetyltransferase n=1 Tax=Virgibacillus ihumii TaxID=2686091 RepID=UPI00157D4BA7|nr:GNAT family N-acetyltransferase [Virgibacillus ihumii]
MIIRLLEPSDADKYWQLRLEALKQNPEAFAVSYDEAMERENPIESTAQRLGENCTFGAFNDEELVGMVTLLQQQSPLKLKHKAHLLAMYVSPKMRGEGVGEQLLVEAIHYAESIGAIEILQLAVVTSNEKTIRLYKKLGFEVFGLEKRALKFGDTYYDEELMALSLKTES